MVHITRVAAQTCPSVDSPFVLLPSHRLTYPNDFLDPCLLYLLSSGLYMHTLRGRCSLGLTVADIEIIFYYDWTASSTNDATLIVLKLICVRF